MIDELRAFVVVVQEHSITKAADRMHLTQSAVSRRIQQLEIVVGGALLDRASRPPTPTALGNRVYEHALNVIRNIDGLMRLAKKDSEPAGTFKLGISHALSEWMSLSVVQALASEYPSLEVRLMTGWSAALQAAINGQEIDAAVTLMGEHSAAYQLAQSQRIASVNVAIIQSKKRPLVPSNVTMAELSDQKWVLNPLGCGYRAEIEKMLNSPRQNIHIAVDTYGAELQLNMIASGVGLGVAPEPLIRASAFRDQIELVNVSDFFLQLDVCIMHSPDPGNMSKAINLISEIVRDDIERT